MSKRTKRPASTRANFKYVVLAFNAWDSINACIPMQVAVHPIGRSVGFMLVYDSIAELRKDYPSSDFCTIKPTGERVRPEHE